MSADDGWLVPPAREPLNGSEEFVGIDAKVEDFWQFALGDLRMNNARGYLAEFIVAMALGLQKVHRTEWDAYDVIWEGITIEVKSSAYLQLWDQRRLSKIVFTGLTGTRWHPRHDLDPSGRRLNAMVYVFCVQTATEHDGYESLRLDQWIFYVVPRSKLAALGRRASVSLEWSRSAAGRWHGRILPQR
ncbi:MAG TPA: hypothetical protein VN108_05630 [Marmoricola sp.]|nr:hypothetical protein [Marmoricola sp.]